MVNKTLSKMNQKGSMLVEAMAMLALIALVTPTLYKKSAERTTELQDINTATHIRTLAKAVDNYVSTHYNELLNEDLTADDATKELDVENEEDMKKLANFLPYGYSFDNLKNFGKPKIAIKKQGDTRNVTSFVQLPKKIDIGEMRAARIASMVGTNGGYVDKDEQVKGVGGVWGLSTEELGALSFDKNTGSLVVASIEAINDASLGHMDDDKYLQRTGEIPEGEEYRHTMELDLLMDDNAIRDVKQIIVGASTADTDDGLYIADGKNAYIGGNTEIDGALYAIGGAFSVSRDNENPVLALESGGSEYLYADNTRTSMQGGALEVGPDYVYATKDTYIDGSLSVGASRSGEYIYATGTSVSLMNRALEVTNAGSSGAENEVVVADFARFRADGESVLKGKTTIGHGEAIAPGFITDNDKILIVKGDTSIAGDLEATNIYGETIDFLNLKAGGEKGGHRWLHATNEGVKVNDGASADPRLKISERDTVIAGAGGYVERSKLNLGEESAVLEGVEQVLLQTTEDANESNIRRFVNIQEGAIKVEGKPNQNTPNNVIITATDTWVNTGDFRIETDADASTAPQFQVAKDDGETSTRITTDKLGIRTSGLEITGNKYLRVADTAVQSGERKPIVDINDTELTFNEYNPNAQTGSDADTVMKVEITDVEHNRDAVMNSVYIRKGAIEVQPNDLNASSDADTGKGYVEASRFVSNALDASGKLATPYVATATDGSSDIYYVDGQANDYDRYMVNPAYTSVMHDIKLTTRGGARLSDILPDFINKGIYVVTNTFRDNIPDVDSILPGDPEQNENQIVPYYNGTEVKEAELSSNNAYEGVNRWASPFLGIVPAPLCPPGYAKVITISPAGFKMAQAGKMVRDEMYNPYKGSDKIESRFFINIAENEASSSLAHFYDDLKSQETVSYGQWTENKEEKIYYLGHSDHNEMYPTPLYFQQSTWLRSEAKPAYIGGNEIPENFAGWIAKMGFMYPATQYASIISKLMGKSVEDVKDYYYWNVFPVETATLEGYATVYCYFDRSNIFKSGNDPVYVDQYDQLNNFRRSGKKQGATRDNAIGADSNNAEYIKRLNDPSLTYTDPW